MAALKVCVVALVVLTGLVAARPETPGYGAPPSKGMPYDFAYAVKDDYSGNDFGHNEQSDGNLVTGEYFVLLPDGRLQTVTYTADHETGFVADVKYEGEAQYPPPAPAGYQ
ncbi:hypothetical protein Pcinc_021771 [Petrolisthes cinctipes]|uniref:Cuticle protein 7 n=1 Tax=Petrolisthes cinctipes TaxID=88211 RepID=A0AAE1KHU9_PETCI|nr:hypothetical protein Pcinc_021771 [Petrolisthes cinctipes]